MSVGSVKGEDRWSTDCQHRIVVVGHENDRRSATIEGKELSIRWQDGRIISLRRLLLIVCWGDENLSVYSDSNRE